VILLQMKLVCCLLFVVRFCCKKFGDFALLFVFVLPFFLDLF